MSTWKLVALALLAALVAGSLGMVVQRRLGDGVVVPQLGNIVKTQDLMPDMELPKLGQMPPIEGIAGWINSNGVIPEDLKGRVVLVDFWTYSCINCIRTLPYVTAWNEKYGGKDFIVIGVHTPEFDFEKDKDNVARAVADDGIKYPVALDNDYVTWTNFHNRFWPAHYLFDKEGQLRYYHFGEGEYDKTEEAIQQLLGIHAPEVIGKDAQDFSLIKSPETYFGYHRAERLASPETPVKDAPGMYTLPESLPLNEWAIAGQWKVGAESAVLTGESGSFQFHFDAGQVILVTDTADRKQVLAEVKMDGKPVPEGFMGKNLFRDSDGRTFTYLEYPGPLFLIDGPAGNHVLQLDFQRPNAMVFSVTFGAKKN